MTHDRVGFTQQRPVIQSPGDEDSRRQGQPAQALSVFLLQLLEATGTLQGGIIPLSASAPVIVSPVFLP